MPGYVVALRQICASEMLKAATLRVEFLSHHLFYKARRKRPLQLKFSRNNDVFNAATSLLDNDMKSSLLFKFQVMSVPRLAAGFGCVSSGSTYVNLQTDPDAVSQYVNVCLH